MLSVALPLIVIYLISIFDGMDKVGKGLEDLG